MGALTVMAMSVDGWVAAIVMLSGAVSYALVKTAPSLGSTIRELGGAWVDVRIKYRRELTALNARIASVESVADKNASAVVNVRKLALEEAEKAKTESIEKAVQIEKEAKDKRHALANQVSGQISNVRTELLEAYDEIAKLKAETARLKVKHRVTDSSHAIAINSLGQDVVEIVGAMDNPPANPPVIPHLEPQSGDSNVELSPPNLNSNHNGGKR